MEMILDGIERGSQRLQRNIKNKRPADTKSKFKQHRSRISLKYDQQDGFFTKIHVTLQTDAERLEDMRFEMLCDIQTPIK